MKPLAVWILLTTLNLVAVACRQQDTGSPDRPEPERPLSRNSVLPAPKWIFLVTLDTLRADHLGCYGYPRDTSPFIDGLAHEGFLFTRAYSTMATTVPSHASIFTSLYPIQHKVFKNGHVLDDAVVTLAEILAAEGFETAAFVSTPRQFGPSNLFQGFATFDEPRVGAKAYRPGRETAAVAISWLERQAPSKPLFLWMHLFDPHLPYSEKSQSADGLSLGSRLSVDFFLNQHHTDFSFYDDDPGKLLREMEQYDREIRLVDQAVEDLYRSVEKRAGNVEGVWVLTADHGESLGNHMWRGHGLYVYNELVRVPLVFHSSLGKIPAGTSHEIVEHVDLVPTLLDLLGIVPPETKIERQGRSLVPLLLGQEWDGSDRQAMSQRRRYGPESRKGAQATMPDVLPYMDGDTYSLQGLRYKYILNTARKDELYDMENDFYETENLVGRGLPEESEYRRLLVDRLRELAKLSVEGSRSMDEEDLEALRALGYVQ